MDMPRIPAVTADSSPTRAGIPVMRVNPPKKTSPAAPKPVSTAPLILPGTLSNMGGFSSFFGRLHDQVFITLFCLPADIIHGLADTVGQTLKIQIIKGIPDLIQQFFSFS